LEFGLVICDWRLVIEERRALFWIFDFGLKTRCATEQNAEIQRGGNVEFLEDNGICEWAEQRGLRRGSGFQVLLPELESHARRAYADGRGQVARHSRLAISSRNLVRGMSA
jgi:hypothetical protein